MTIFDGHIARVRAVLEDLRRRGESFREFHYPLSAEDLLKGLPVRVGEGANPGIILRSDTFVELGNPEVGSTSLFLWTDTLTLVRDGCITVCGPDIPESAGASLPFAQILIVGGKRITREKHERIQEHQHVADRIEGYMVRTSARSVWGRVSKEAASKGFSFETLGRALMSLMRAGAPGEVEAVEVVFVTSRREDVRRLDEIAAEVQGITSGIVKEVWKEKGYDIECDYNCTTCTHKPVCDEIRDLNALRKEKEKQTGTIPSPPPDGGN